MNRTVYILFAFAAVLASCTKESDKVSNVSEPSEEDNIVTLTAGLEMGAATKVVIGEDGVGKYLKWEDGDVISIGINNVSNGSVAGQINATVNVDGDKASVTFSYDASKYYITDARYPQGGTNPAIPTTQYMWRGKVILPLTAAYDGSQSMISFSPTVGDDWTIVQYRLKKGNAEKSLSSIALSFAGGTTYTLDTKTKMGPGSEDVSVALTDSEQSFYIVLPSGSTPGELKATFTMEDGTVYTRTKKTFTPTAKKLHTMPVLSDLDNTGKHLWFFGGQTNPTESPFQYWYDAKKLDKPFGIVENHSGSVDEKPYTYSTITLTPNGDKTQFSANMAVALGSAKRAQYCSDGVNVVTGENTLTIHAGNYPIFAIMMNSPWKYGNSRNPNFDSDDVTQSQYRGNLKGRTFLKDGVINYEKNLPEPSIFYYDLSGDVFTTGGKPVDTRAIEMITWQLKFDRGFASAHDADVKYNIYWAGFFNSLTELKSFAKTNFLYKAEDLPTENY